LKRSREGNKVGFMSLEIMDIIEFVLFAIERKLGDLSIREAMPEGADKIFEFWLFPSEN
jgi:hypothetical protein